MFTAVVIKKWVERIQTRNVCVNMVSVCLADHLDDDDGQSKHTLKQYINRKKNNDEILLNQISCISNAWP